MVDVPGVLGATALLGFASAGLIFALYALHSVEVFIRARLRPPLPPSPPAPAGADAPFVTVQLVVCNERDLVEHAVLSVLELDYPRDRLELQICDDSTDPATIALCTRMTDVANERGLQTVRCVREGREGFKAGNLNSATATARGELLALLDTDARVPADFLLRLVPAFAKDPKLAAAQAHFTHRNSAQNALTESMQASYDYHFEVEQPTRTRWDLWMEFNGSCGLWRKAALLKMGGWPVGTGTEDVYLSFRAQAEGWRIAFFDDLTCDALLTPRADSFLRQQTRWALSCGFILRSLFWKMLTSPARLAARKHGLFHLGGYLMQVAMVLALLTSAPALAFLWQHPSWQWVGAACGLAYPALSVASGLVMGEAQRRAKGPRGQSGRKQLLLALVMTGLAPVIGASFVLGLFGVRIRAWGASHGSAARGQLLGWTWTTLCGAAGVAGLVVAVATQQWLAALPLVMVLPGVFFVLTSPLWARSMERRSPWSSEAASR